MSTGNGVRVTGYGVRITAGFLLICALNGCTTPTYPKEKLEKSVIDICKREYSLDVKAAANGKTLAIYLPLENLIDFTFSITKTAKEKINDCILSAARVALSTDADINFYCIIAHDIHVPEIQIVIIDYVEDVKRFLLNDISRGEYAKRTLIDMKLSPQAEKERALKEIFEKMKLDRKWQDDLIRDFFSSSPAIVSDIGYWNGRFYIKDVELSEFIAEQISSRIRIEFKEDKNISKIFFVKQAKCIYVHKDGKHYYTLEITLDKKVFDKPEEEAALAPKMLEKALGIAAAVLHNYKFTDFEYLEIFNQTNKDYLKAAPEEIDLFRQNKIRLEDIVNE